MQTSAIDKPILPPSEYLSFNAYSLVNRLAILITTLLILSLAACSDNPQPAIINSDTNNVAFACVKYDSAALEYRLDSIQTRGFTMQFYLPEAANSKSAYQLISYAFDTLGDYPNSWIPDTLRVVTDSLPKSFSGRVILGNNEVTREQLYDVLNDEHGKRISYDYIVFTPTIDGNFNHLVYRIRAVKGNITAPGANGKTQISSPLPPARVW
jgi:hypothetical protein